MSEPLVSKEVAKAIAAFYEAVMSYRLADFDVRDFETLYAMHAKAADEALLKLKDAKLKRDARLKAMLDTVNAPRPKGEKG